MNDRPLAKIVVDGQEYFWSMKKDHHGFGRHIHFTAYSATHHSSPFRAVLNHLDEREIREETLFSPRLAAALIRQAGAEGWDPLLPHKPVTIESGKELLMKALESF